MTISPTTKSGNFYKTRSGFKVEIYTIGKDYIFGAIDRGFGWNSITWKSDGTHEILTDLDIISLYENECPIVKLVSKCECGSEKCGLPGHLPYCPKYTKI